MTLQPASTPADRMVARVLAGVAERTGLTFPLLLREQAEAAVRRFLEDRHGDIASLDAAAEEPAPAVWDALFDCLAVKETYFMREPAQFDVLVRDIVPELLRTRPPGSPLRLWCAGCATGEEAYSLAIALAERGYLRQCHILGTDWSTEAIARAQKGIYRRWSFRGGISDQVRPFVSKVGNQLWAVDQVLKEHVRFARHNLWSGAPPPYGPGQSGAFDVILCRNVLLYFPSRATTPVCAGLASLLVPGGWLIISASDPLPIQLQECETVLTRAGCMFRRRLRSEAVLAGTHLHSSFSHESQGAAGRTGFLEAPETSGLPGGVDEQVDRLSGEDSNNPDIADPSTPSTASGQDTMEALVAAVESAPLDGEAHLALAFGYLEQDRCADAAESLRRALYLNPSNILAHFAAGIAFKRLGDSNGARREFTNTVRLAVAVVDAAANRPVTGSTGELILAAQRELRGLGT